MRDVIGEVLPRAISHSVNLSYVAREEYQVLADKGLLALMFQNILGNAIKYGRKEVEVHVLVRDQSLVIKVLDDGPGVDEDELPQLFERFFRGQDAKQQAEGSGLGLSIVRRVAELHGFSVAACNPVEGGLCVSVTIPAGSWESVEVAPIS
ncbi:sensor histidine kinase [Thiolapillus brandeum]|uniref:sensor histidine kinase n=1 Tax=Thiolapillus brandeum TaxID=1076588 RepID=UPI001184AE61|nr:HAMP domain-containing sensor histidine kinase [Thiolapillus brandeum]